MLPKSPQRAQQYAQGAHPAATQRTQQRTTQPRSARSARSSHAAVMPRRTQSHTWHHHAAHAASRVEPSAFPRVALPRGSATYPPTTHVVHAERSASLHSPRHGTRHPATHPAAPLAQVGAQPLLGQLGGPEHSCRRQRPLGSLHSRWYAVAPFDRRVRSSRPPVSPPPRAYGSSPDSHVATGPTTDSHVAVGPTTDSHVTVGGLATVEPSARVTRRNGLCNDM